MRTALNAPDAALDDNEKKFVADIREHGWFGTNVFAESDEPGFYYTTGFWVTLGKPELIVFGLKSEIAHAVLWDVFRALRDGKVLLMRRRTADVFGNHQACLFSMDRSHYPKYLGWSRWFYGSDEFPSVQLVWPDRRDVFPWEPGFDPDMARLQPDVSEGGWGVLSA